LFIVMFIAFVFYLRANMIIVKWFLSGLMQARLAKITFLVIVKTEYCLF
jgi:hypothetical protein